MHSSIDAAAAAPVIIYTADGVAIVEGGVGVGKTDGVNAWHNGATGTLPFPLLAIIVL